MAEARIHEEAPGVTRMDHGWGGPGFIASYLLADRDDLALVEAGPASTLDTLLAGIRGAGHDPARLTHILLTHVHLDHAAGAGQLARIAPGATVHVHPFGEPHIVDPSRLLASAGRLYGDRMQEMWGTMLPVPRERIRTLADGESVHVGGRVLVALDTPGHAAHHLSFHEPDAGLVFTGDVGGIRLEGARHVRPPTPPPEVDTPAWLRSIDKLRAVRPRMLLPTHFGGSTDVEWHLDDLAARLVEWTRTARGHGPDPLSLAAELSRSADAELLAAAGDPDLVRRYATSIPYEMMAAGLLRQEKVNATRASRGSTS
ncbi:MAG TPA: MBL fold metallo-hydrolase [Longimicrobium sp.]|nr:MBL fold metallo-hydrolase [Longimicrobium sp.]